MNDLLSNVSKCVYEVSRIQLIDENKLQALLSKISCKLNIKDVDKFFKSKDIFTYEFKKLVTEYVTINETFFFRHHVHFDFIKKHLKSENINNVRALSAACSTGEEAYSLAMILKDSLISYKITGVDIDLDSIKKAQAAIYEETTIKRINEHYRYLVNKNVNTIRGIAAHTIKVKDAIKNNVNFVCNNIFKASFLSYNVIFCRNVLIYFSREDQILILEKLIRHLEPKGILFLGAGEMLPATLKHELVKQDAGIFYKVPSND